MLVYPKEAFIMGRRLRADRICFVDREKGAVRLFLHATNSLLVEMKADLIPPSDTGEGGIEAVSLDTGYQSEDILKIMPERLNNHKLLVHFNAQSVHPDFDRGKIELDFFQENQRCIISKPATWVRIVPKYGTGRSFEWTTIIQFCVSA
jgi:hypothetical protein